eukprot:m.208320 g.208320  ORF g.208320 m.208320 type:complete len:91 (-) comp13764_c1_seq6:218-490(-)
MRSWLVGEGEKRGHSIILDEWTDVNGHGPLQDNTNDCGVFASQVGNSLAVGENLWFCQDDMPRLRKEMIVEIARGELHPSLKAENLVSNK